jgi:hypothetical protein
VTFSVGTASTRRTARHSQRPMSPQRLCHRTVAQEPGRGDQQQQHRQRNHNDEGAGEDGMVVHPEGQQV